MKKFKKSGTFYVYIVRCKGGTYYTGYTPDLERRVKLHNAGRGAKYTKYRRPVRLIWHKEYKYFKHAFLEEKRIKGLTRDQKDKLVKEAASKHLSVFIKTFGCQMNVKDSETILGMLKGAGYAMVDSPEKSDVVLFNTCSVRAHAEERAINNVAVLRALKEEKPKLVIGIVGCMAKAKGKELFEKLPHLDFISGPANIYEIPDIIKRFTQRDSPLRGQSLARLPLRLSAIDKDKRDVIHYPLSAIHNSKTSPCAFLNIMEGCDNYCSYCIVPYARGHEVSRPIRDILKEAKCLIASGVKDITLLGQNVNSYKGIAYSVERIADRERPYAIRYPLNAKTYNFVELLKAIDKIAGNCRIRFMTNHPKDASEELFRAMKDFKSVCGHIHLPVQSGSDRILKCMNRRYTRANYLKLIESLRRHVPDCAVTTDIITGFPGETDSDFKKTQDIMRKADFDSSFIFKYSPRPLTKAARLADDVPKSVKEDRNQILLGLQRQISLKKNEALIGETVEVLAEGEAKKGAGLFGRTRANKSVVFSGRKKMIGEFVDVKVKKVTPNTLIGSVFLAALASMLLLGTPASYCQTVQDDSKKAFSHAEELFLREDYEGSAKECEALDAPLTDDALRHEAVYLCGLSYLKLDKPISAREKFERLLFDPKATTFHDKAVLGLGDTYFLSGNYQRAKNEYQKLVSNYKESPLMPSAYFKLAESEKAEGHWNKAKEYYEVVSNDYPSSLEAKLANEFLNKGEFFFTVQVGAFASMGNAAKLKDELAQKGYDSYLVEPAKGDMTLYRVRVGKFRNKDEALALKTQLEAQGLPCKIIP